jgi:hypothetical protein
VRYGAHSGDFVLAPPCLLSQRSKCGNASTGTSQCRYFTFQLKIHIGLLKEGGSISIFGLRFKIYDFNFSMCVGNNGCFGVWPKRNYLFQLF